MRVSDIGRFYQLLRFRAIDRNLVIHFVPFERKRNRPRLRTGFLRVRDRFRAVEMPLNRTKKSQNARIRSLKLLSSMGKSALGSIFFKSPVFEAASASKFRSFFKAPGNSRPMHEVGASDILIAEAQMRPKAPAPAHESRLFGDGEPGSKASRSSCRFPRKHW